MKILFIAYYFEPYNGVGAKRISYWAKHISEKSNNVIQATVITATPPNENTLKDYRNIIYLKDSKKSVWKNVFKMDPGVTWLNDLKKYFISSSFDYDIVCITGGPFLHFGIGSYLKKKFDCKIVLDFRDPFAINPLFKNQNFFKVLIKRHLEKKYISAADSLITVNKYCAELLNNKNKVKVEIINNGFDETVVKEINKNYEYLNNNKINIVYAGKLSLGRDIIGFLNFVENNSKLFFHYIGSDYHLVKNRKNTKVYGTKSYKETLQIIKKCDVGLILTGGHKFESTTKIFDYIGLEKKILVISNSKILKGSLMDILKIYNKSVFCSNENKDYYKILEENIYENIALDIDTSLFSRDKGLSSLIRVLIKL